MRPVLRSRYGIGRRRPLHILTDPRHMLARSEQSTRHWAPRGEMKEPTRKQVLSWASPPCSETLLPSPVLRVTWSCELKPGAHDREVVAPIFEAGLRAIRFAQAAYRHILTAGLPSDECFIQPLGGRTAVGWRAPVALLLRLANRLRRRPRIDPRSAPHHPGPVERDCGTAAHNRRSGARHGAALVIAVCPDKQSIYPQYLPTDKQPRPGAVSRLDQFWAMAATLPDVPLADLRQRLMGLPALDGDRDWFPSATSLRAAARPKRDKLLVIGADGTNARQGKGDPGPAATGGEGSRACHSALAKSCAEPSGRG